MSNSEAQKKRIKLLRQQRKDVTENAILPHFLHMLE